MEGVLVVAVLVLMSQICPDEPRNMSSLFAVDELHMPQSTCEKDDADANMFSMVITFDTSHLAMSLLNDDAERNM